MLCALALSALAWFAGPSSGAGREEPSATVRVSVATDGSEGNAYSSLPSISADGRFVAFHSPASNLVGGDANESEDVFVHDSASGVTERVSVDSEGNEATGDSKHPSISGDGRFVAFHSAAADLVADDTNAQSDIFVHDRALGVTERASLAFDGSQADGACTAPVISADGRYVAFVSEAANLVAGDTNGVADVFVRDRQLGITERVSITSGGDQADGASDWPGISAGGRYVVFVSVAAHLVAGDTNGVADIFVRDRQTGITGRVSIAAGGAQANGVSMAASISADGRFVAFTSLASNLVPGDTNGAGDVFVRDRELQLTERVSVTWTGGQANAPSGNTSISADGQYVAFDSLAGNLVSGDTNDVEDVFVHDRQARTVQRVSIASGGSQANLWSGLPAIAADGRFVAFVSEASNLASGDTNHVLDVFLHWRSPSASGSPVSYLPLIAAPEPEQAGGQPAAQSSETVLNRPRFHVPGGRQDDG